MEVHVTDTSSTPKHTTLQLFAGCTRSVDDGYVSKPWITYVFAALKQGLVTCVLEIHEIDWDSRLEF